MQYVPRDREDQEQMKNRYSLLSFLIGEYVVGRKAKRNREILREYFLDGYTYEEIAEHKGMSPVQIGRIVHKYGDPILMMINK